MKWKKPNFEELPLNIEITDYITTDQNQNRMELSH